MSENTPKKKQSRLNQSHHIKEIEAILASGCTLQAARKIIIEKFDENWAINTLQRHRNKLRKLAEQAKVVKATKDARPNSLVYELKTMGMDLLKVMDIHLDPNHEKYGEVEALKKRISSFFRRASEFYEVVDHLAVLCFLVNTQLDRVVQQRELEVKLGVVLKEGAVNIKLLLDLAMSSLRAHQEMGLKPKFGDPTLNVQVNVGSGSQVTIGGSQSEWNAKLVAVEKALQGLTGEERDKKLRELAFKHMGIEDANFTDTLGKRAEGDANT